VALGDEEVIPWRRLASVLRAPSVSAKRKTLLKVNINFEGNESDSYKYGRRDFQIQILQKKKSFRYKPASQRDFQLHFSRRSFISDGDIEQTLSNINMSSYLSTVSKGIKGSTVSLCLCFEEIVYKSTFRDRVVFCSGIC